MGNTLKFIQSRITLDCFTSYIEAILLLVLYSKYLISKMNKFGRNKIQASQKYSLIPGQITIPKVIPNIVNSKDNKYIAKIKVFSSGMKCRMIQKRTVHVSVPTLYWYCQHNRQKQAREIAGELCVTQACVSSNIMQNHVSVHPLTASLSFV